MTKLPCLHNITDFYCFYKLSQGTVVYEFPNTELVS